LLFSFLILLFFQFNNFLLVFLMLIQNTHDYSRYSSLWEDGQRAENLTWGVHDTFFKIHKGIFQG